MERNKMTKKATLTFTFSYKEYSGLTNLTQSIIDRVWKISQVLGPTFGVKLLDNKLTLPPEEKEGA
jgi:hypothetical protein